MNLLPLAAAALAVLLLIWPLAPWAAENTAVTATTPTSDFVLDDVNGTAYHQKIGLTWKRCAEGQTWNGSTCTGAEAYYSWPQALNLASGGWRLPNLKELNSIIEQRNYGPAINVAVFTATPSNYFWSASPYAPPPPATRGSSVSTVASTTVAARATASPCGWCAADSRLGFL